MDIQNNPMEVKISAGINKLVILELNCGVRIIHAMG